MADNELVIFLNDAATYFEKRPTGGEDMAHWANVYNAENCRKAANEIKALRKEVEELRERLGSKARPEAALSDKAHKKELSKINGR